jgi:hypothetical protein
LNISYQFSNFLRGILKRSASFLTSSATTANPRPCSPALAASMAAFNAVNLFVKQFFYRIGDIADQI